MKIKKHLLVPLAFTKESDISVDGHPGRFLQVELKGDAVVRSKYVPVRNRMYVVSVGTPKGRPNVLGAENNYEKIATSFLDSFKIIQSIGADESEAWTEFSSTEGRFKILFPGTPLQSSMQMELSHGNSLIHVASYQSSIAYSVKTFDEVCKFIQPHGGTSDTDEMRSVMAKPNVLRIGVARRVDTTNQRHNEPPHNSVLN